MKPGVKQDAAFGIVGLVLLAVYIAVGFAMGKVEHGPVTDMILTDWIMYGFGGFFAAAILYSSVRGANAARSTVDSAASETSRTLSGRTVAVIMSLFAAGVIAVLAKAILSDS